MTIYKGNVYSYIDTETNLGLVMMENIHVKAINPNDAVKKVGDYFKRNYNGIIPDEVYIDIVVI